MLKVFWRKILDDPIKTCLKRNKEIENKNLAIYTWGNVSIKYGDKYIIIKPNKLKKMSIYQTLKMAFSKMEVTGKIKIKVVKINVMLVLQIHSRKRGFVWMDPGHPMYNK